MDDEELLSACCVDDEALLGACCVDDEALLDACCVDDEALLDACCVDDEALLGACYVDDEALLGACFVNDEALLGACYVDDEALLGACCVDDEALLGACYVEDSFTFCVLLLLPETENEWMAVAKEFEEKWNFPHAIGAMDGKHVRLQAPLNTGTEFYNYKQYSSVVLLAFVDADYNFMYVNVGCQGRISNGGVFKNTSLYRNLENKSINLPNPEILQTPYNVKVPYMIMCDKAFALSEYTMKPFSGNPEKGSIERIFNYRLSRARRVVENAFGILSSMFRVLRKPMLLEPDKGTKIVLATVYLHNFLRKSRPSNIYAQTNAFDSEQRGELITGAWRQDQQQLISFFPLDCVPRRSPNTATHIRLHLAEHFVNNTPLECQNNK